MFDKKIACPCCGCHEYDDVIDNGYEITPDEELRVWEHRICTECGECFTAIYYADTYKTNSIK